MTRRGREPEFAGGSEADFLVYGDLLAQRGDPRGELIHVQHALARTPKDRKLRAAQAQLFADHPELAPPPKPKHNLRFRQTLTWRLGFIDTARVVNLTPDVFAALVDHPSARFLRRLEVSVGMNIAPTIVLTLARAPRRALRELVLLQGDIGGVIEPATRPTYPTDRGHGHRKGDALWEAAPHLELLEVRGFGLFHSLVLPELRELIAIGYPFCTTPWQAPKLASLTWRVGNKEHLETATGSRRDDVLDVALASELAALRRLDLRDCETENPYDDTVREPFETTLRRARRKLDVAL